MSEPQHPGTVTFFDQENGTRWSEPAGELPEAMRFRNGVPVVRVVLNASGDVFSTYEYGPNNEYLRSTTGFRTPPPEPKHPGTVTYVDEEKGTQWSKPAEELPARSRLRHSGRQGGPHGW
jgi:hypothetical protein